MIARKIARARVIDDNKKYIFIAEKLDYDSKKKHFWFFYDKAYFNLQYSNTSTKVKLTLILYYDDYSKNKLGISVESKGSSTLYDEIDISKYCITRSDLYVSKLKGLSGNEYHNVKNKLRIAYGNIRDAVYDKIITLLDKVDGFWDYTVEEQEYYGGDTMLHIKF